MRKLITIAVILFCHSATAQKIGDKFTKPCGIKYMVEYTITGNGQRLPDEEYLHYNATIQVYKDGEKYGEQQEGLYVAEGCQKHDNGSDWVTKAYKIKKSKGE